jgi:hypothetical protein
MSETAIVVENRKELTYLLCQAAELVHGLMCEYLYAAFSLRSTVGPGLRADAAWLRFTERLDELAGFADGVRPPAGADVTGTVAVALRRAASNLAAHIETA